MLLLAPTPRDAQLARSVLADAGIVSHACADLSELLQETSQGAGALLLAEESLPGEPALQALSDLLGRQPPWSDLPILLLARTGADSSTVQGALRTLGNVTVLERPVRVAALTTAAHTALRARHRQYKARLHLEELDATARALGDSESRLKALFSNAAVGIAELRPGGELTLVNDALCELLGAPRGRLTGLEFGALAHHEDRTDIERILRDVFRGEVESATVERRLVHEKGQLIWARITLSIARVTDGAGMRAVAVVEDCTERKIAETDLRDADRRKDEFLATLAHELRNPLAPIRNSLHIFRVASKADPALGRVTDMMERQVAHMVRMVDDLLEVSRISRGKIELQRERVSLADIVRNAIETGRPLIEAAQHRLELDMQPDDLQIIADPMRLAQVFANLLNNAAKYTPPGGRIEVRLGRDGSDALVCVKDNGEGIAPHMLERVFSMFTQVNTGMRAQGGLGIGLTLARTLVHLHGGSIEARSDGVDRGCEFRVRLPLAEPAGSAGNPPEVRGDAAHAALARVLVVDDNRDAAEALGLLLTALGAEVEVVHDGPAALERAPQFRPGVVLLDLGMPGMNGLEVARRMREDERLAGLRLVALTGWGQSEDRRRTKEAGFDHHLVKPADLDTLQSILAAPVEPVAAAAR